MNVLYSSTAKEINNGAVLSPAKLSNISDPPYKDNEIAATSEKVNKYPLSIAKSEPQNIGFRPISRVEHESLKLEDLVNDSDKIMFEGRPMMINQNSEVCFALDTELSAIGHLNKIVSIDVVSPNN